MNTIAVEMPDALYCPPSEWGDFPSVITEEAANEFLEWAQNEDGWENASIDDAEKLTMIRIISSGIALYEGRIHHDGYHKNCRHYGYVVQLIGDDFKVLDQLDTVQDCDDSDYI